MAKKKTIPAVPASLRYALVLNSYMLSLFGYRKWEGMAEHLREPQLEATDSEGHTLFARELALRGYMGTISEDDLLRYDDHIQRHTRSINARRTDPIRWKYFQYVALLFTEVYLDRYFADAQGLCDALNTFLIEDFNQRPDTYHDVAPFTLDDLHKLALWNATGSGKTLLMHVNLLQYRHYAQRAEHRWNRTLLITPNEGLTRQHLDEMRQSGLTAQGFTKNTGTLFAGEVVDAIEITKLSETMGEKTVAVDSFESNNLVLVDEGHRGASGEVWRTMRDKIAATGFTFEYSATFGQVAVKDKKQDLLSDYAKSVLMDYSYKWFYGDGYGKDYRILNLNNAWNPSTTELYLTACLLAFYEQQLVFANEQARLRPYMIENPLAIFVGTSVTATNKEGRQAMSDVVTILHFFERFIGDTATARTNIGRLLAGEDGLVDATHTSIFAHSFTYLHTLKQEPEAIYDDMLRRLFHSTVAGAVLHLDNLRGADGEIGMRMGDGDYFGVINVGDTASLVKLCESVGIQTHACDFTGRSLFASINEAQSPINVLIGSKKFTEGWNSWRVSTMGLMNVGKSEGANIIQLFGRGVRLKGYGMSLKRSSALHDVANKPPYIGLLETLNIFGVKADYMEQFKQYLEQEGLPTNDSNFEEVTIPVLPTVDLSGVKLKYIRVKEGEDFRKSVVVDVAAGRLHEAEVSLDYYSKIQILQSRTKAAALVPPTPNEDKLTQAMLAWVDWPQVWHELQQLKNDRGWWNMNLPRKLLPELLRDGKWYRLAIPKDALLPADFARSRRLWTDLAATLLALYIERQYNKEKAQWMSEHVETVTLDSSNPNFEKEYTLLVHHDLENVLINLAKLKEALAKKDYNDMDLGSNLRALCFSQHLYQPLLCLTGPVTDAGGEALIEIKPVALNRGETQFVADLKAYYLAHPQEFADKQLYLLRNKSRKGIGFFEANNFYPDFILWLVSDQHQYIAFVDPKGIVHLAGLDDPKIRLAQVIHNDIEKRLHDPDITLSSFIVSDTPLDNVKWWAHCADMADEYAARRTFHAHNVYFQEEQTSYIRNILGAMQHAAPVQ